MGGAGEPEDLTTNAMSPPQIYVERTLAIIKPDALDKAEEIEDIVLRNGFTILQVCYLSDIFFKQLWCTPQ